MTPLAALILDWIITAFWPILGAMGMRYYSGLLFSVAGLLIGLILILPWLLAKGRWRRIIAPDVAPYLFGVGFFSGTATAIYISALGYTTPANAAIMAQIEVIYSALLCSFFLKERLTLKQTAAGALVMGGTGLIMFHDLHSARWKGDLMILATPWMYQCSHILSKRMPKGLDPTTITGGRIFYGLIAMAPFCLWQLAHGPRWSWEPAAVSLLLVQGLTMSCLNFVLWYMAILHMDLSKATTIMLSYPALTVLFSWMLGRETIRTDQLIGLALTFTGAYWVSRLVLQAEKSLPKAQRPLPVETGPN